MSNFSRGTWLVRTRKVLDSRVTPRFKIGRILGSTGANSYSVEFFHYVEMRDGLRQYRFETINNFPARRLDKFAVVESFEAGEQLLQETFGK